MNQQRSRRFRAAQEAQEKEESKQESMKLFEGEKRAAFDTKFCSSRQSIWFFFAEGGGKYTEEEKEKLKKKGWDTNAITPGKFLMSHLVAAVLETDTLHISQVHPSWISSHQVSDTGCHSSSTTIPDGRT